MVGNHSLAPESKVDVSRGTAWCRIRDTPINDVLTISELMKYEVR